MRHSIFLFIFYFSFIVPSHSQSLAASQACLLRCTALCLQNSSSTPLNECQASCSEYNNPNLCSDTACWTNCRDLGAATLVNAPQQTIHVSGKKISWQISPGASFYIVQYQAPPSTDFNANDVLLTRNNTMNTFDFPGMNPCEQMNIRVASVYSSGVTNFSSPKHLEAAKPSISPKLVLEKMIYENTEYVNDFYRANGTIRVVFRYITDDWPLGDSDLVVEPMFHLINCLEPDLTQGMPLPEFTSDGNNTLVGLIGSDMMYRKCRFLYYAQGVTSTQCETSTYFHSPSADAMQTLNINCDTVESAPCVRVERYQSPICGQVDDISYQILGDNVGAGGTNLTLNVTFSPVTRTGEEPTIYYLAFYGNATNYKSKEEEAFLGVNITHLLGHISNCYELDKDGYCVHQTNNSVIVNSIDMDKIYGITFCAVKDPKNLTLPDFTVDSKALRPKANKIYVDSKDFQKNYTAAIVGGLLGGMAGLIVLILFCWFYIYKKMKRKNKKLGLENSQLKMERGNEYTDFPAPEQHDGWEIDRALLVTDEDRKLGSGAFGSVFAGRLLGTPRGYKHATSPLVRNINTTENQEVAVKRLPEYSDEKSRDDFLREIALMKRLGYHERLANIVGCITKSEPLCLVMEYCSDGDLLHFLSDRCKYMMDLDTKGVNYQIPPIDENYDINMIVTMKQLLMFAVQISYGLEYLSQKGFVHRDVAARNILVHEKRSCKIGDFGLCRYMNSENPHYKCKGGRLPLKWMSPEAIRHYEFSTKSDVWAFGILLFEIITLGGAPYPGMKMDELLNFLEDGGRIPQPDNCPEEFYSVMKECWITETDKRPDFGFIRQRLAKQLEDVTEEYSYLRLDAQKDYYNVQYGNEKPDVILIPEEVPEKVPLSDTSTAETEVMDDVEVTKASHRAAKELSLTIEDLLPEGKHSEKIELR